MNVFIIAAITIDGFIGREAGHFPHWTSPEDTKFFISKTKEAGVLVMGATTYQTLLDKGRTLPGRRTIVYTRNPARFDNSVETTSLPPRDLVTKLESEGVRELAVCGGSTIYGLFLESRVVDEMFITVEPVVFGNGIKLFDRELNERFILKDLTDLNRDTRLLHYAHQK